MPTVEATKSTLATILSGLLEGCHKLSHKSVKEHIEILKDRSVNKHRAIQIAEEEARNNKSKYFSDIVREELEYAQNDDLYARKESNVAELEIMESFYAEALEIVPEWDISYDLIPGCILERWARNYCIRQGHISYSIQAYLKVDWAATAENYRRALPRYEIQRMTFYIH